MSYGQACLAAVLIGAIGTASAQVGRESNLWAWTDTADHHQSIVRISINRAVGAGAVIYKDTKRETASGHYGWCVTAMHVVEKLQPGVEVRIRFRNGEETKHGKIIQTDAETDLALIEVDIPRDIPAAKLARDPIVHGNQIEATGLGGGGDLIEGLRSFSGKASPSTGESHVFADMVLLPGDSGGPVFNSHHQLVGIISGGWFWYDAGIRDESGSFVKATWPLRATNTDRLRKLISKAKECSDDCVEEGEQPQLARRASAAKRRAE